MKAQSKRKFNAQVCQEACEWLVEFRVSDPDEATRKAFHAWLRESPAHMGAYLEAAAIWSEGAAVDSNEKWAVDALIAQAAEDPDNVVSFQSEPLPTARRGIAKVRHPRWIAAAAAVVLTAFTAGIMAWLNHAPRYSTGIGEQRSIVFPDGSTVNLNSRSSIRVRYSREERAVDLLQGQALFSVAKDAARPFVVSSDSTQVRAVGTQFDVYKKHGGTVVTVVEGKVAVLDHAQPDIFVSAGEQLTVERNIVERNSVPRPEPTNPVLATAWTQRQLVFESTPLAEVAEEFNRYNERQLQIRDSALNTLEIDGVFSSTDPASLIRFLRARRGVQVTERASGFVIESDSK